MRLTIDPGVSGGFAWQDENSPADAAKMPISEREMWDLLVSVMPRSTTIEYVRSSSAMGVTSAFTFGRSYGTLRMLCSAYGAVFGAPMHEVRPVVWQRGLGLPSMVKAGSPAKKKQAHKARAQELYPYLRVTNATADALLMLRWAKENT